MISKFLGYPPELEKEIRKYCKHLIYKQFDIIKKNVENKHLSSSGPYHYALWLRKNGSKIGEFFPGVFVVELNAYRKIGLINNDEYNRIADLLFSKSPDDVNMGLLSFYFYEKESNKKDYRNSYDKFISDGTKEHMKILIDERTRIN
jgi:hypothetical protein